MIALDLVADYLEGRGLAVTKINHHFTPDQINAKLSAKYMEKYAYLNITAPGSRFHDRTIFQRGKREIEMCVGNRRANFDLADPDSLERIYEEIISIQYQ